MMGLDTLRKWIMGQPRPAALRVTSADGQQHEIICQGQWQRIAETVSALQPDLVQALTAPGPTGALIRAVRPSDHSEDWGDEVEGSARRPIPTLEHIPITAADPETQRFALVAQLIANAYRHSTDIAFTRLVELVDAQNARSDSVERAREQAHKLQLRQLEDQIRALGAEPAEGGDLLQVMLGQFLGGKAMQAASPPPPKPNGKH